MKYSLFQAFGIELEYMLVSPQSLEVAPVADQLLKALTGEFLNDADLGEVGVSNELTRHVIELKNDDPDPNLQNLPAHFHRGILALQPHLEKLGAILLPGGMHPWMNPQTEVKLWPHEYAEVYQAYDRIFGCRTHGFGNIQSVHLNLPFADEAEFVRLHHAIRLVLPLLPALAASSPIYDGRVSGAADSRLLHYAQNQSRLSCVSGQVIPEAIQSISEYESIILQPIYEALKPFDAEGILQQEWINSRGAIARFDRDAIEIRLMDMQECPLMDTALSAVVVALLQALVAERWLTSRDQGKFPQGDLVALLQQCIQQGENAVIDNREYLQVWGYKNGDAPTALMVWQHLLEQLEIDSFWDRPLQIFLSQGNLSTRLLKGVGPQPDHQVLIREYSALHNCLMKNRPYEIIDPAG